MAAVRIEGEAFSDVRYDVLATQAGLSDADHARGKMARIWRQCTMQRAHVLRREIVAAILGERGPDALITSGLGEEHQHGIRIKGTRGRIEWLDDLRKAAKNGGKARAAAASRVGGRFTSHMAGGTPAIATSAAPAVSSALALALAPSPSPAPVPTREGEEIAAGAAVLPLRPSGKRKAKPADLTELERASFREILGRITKWTGVEYRGSDKHAALIAARLREGRTEIELRAIVGYCADPSGLGWSEDDKMRVFLRPETLFGPVSIERYRDPAMAWARKHYPDLVGQEAS